jgi:hypothetical protein
MEHDEIEENVPISREGEAEVKSAVLTPEDEEVSAVLRLLRKNRAAAMGLAVLFLTGALSGGCGLLIPPPNPNTVVIQKALEDEEDDKDPYISGGSHGYFHVGSVQTMSGGRTVWGSSPATHVSGGYAIIRGGSIGG